MLLFAIRAMPARPASIPLNVGNEWVYEGEVRWTEPVTNQIRAAKVSWKTRVVNTYEMNKARAAVLVGTPFELAWFTPDQQPGFSVLVENLSGIFVASAISHQEADALARQGVQNPSKLEQVLQYPVR